MARKSPKEKPFTQEDKERSELLKRVVSVITGPASSRIVDLLYKRQNVNEFDIAKNLDLTINQARNILYKLSDEGVVSFIRKKDKKSGGWYTYFWTLNTGKALLALKNKLEKELNEVGGQLTSKRTKQFYYCENCEIEMSEENALMYDFTCQECGEVMQMKENTEEIKNLETEASKLTELLTKVESELETIGKKEDALNIRRMKTEERKKKAEREAKKLERQKAKKKEKEQTAKKTSAKKTQKKSAKKGPKKSGKKTAKKTSKKSAKKSSPKKASGKKSPSKAKQKVRPSKKSAKKSPKKTARKK